MPAEPIDTVPGVPGTFRWRGAPLAAGFELDALSMSAGPRTDWFVDPGSGETTLNAPAPVSPMASDFTLAARVEMMFRSTFGAGALVVCQDDGSGAKLAFESAPQGHRTIVSVVTRGESDDCNSVVVDSEALWLRMARLGRAHAFHVALDGRDWRVVRHFRIGDRWRTRGGVRGAVAARRGLRGTILRDQLRGRDAG